MTKQVRNSNSAPTFFDSFLESLKFEKQSIGWRAYFPLQLLAMCVVPSLVMWCLKLDFSAKISDDEYVSIFSSMIVFFGILAAFSISAMTQVQSIASKYPFSDYLDELGILNSFIFFPQFTFVLQCLYTVFSLCLIFVKYLFNLPASSIDNLIVLNIGFSMYVLLKTMGLVNLIRLLTWHYAKYEMLYNKVK